MVLLIKITLLLVSFFCIYKISITDFKRRIIPDIYLYPLTLIGLLFIQYSLITDYYQSSIASIIGYGLGILIGFIFKNKSEDTPIGMGDIKLLACGGIWLGINGLAIAIVISSMFAIIWGIVKKQKYIPYAPFFFSGSIISYLISYLFLL